MDMKCKEVNIVFDFPSINKIFDPKSGDDGFKIEPRFVTLGFHIYVITESGNEIKMKSIGMRCMSTEIADIYKRVMEICKDNKSALLYKGSNFEALRNLSIIKLVDFPDVEIVEKTMDQMQSEACDMVCEAPSNYNKLLTTEMMKAKSIR